MTRIEQRAHILKLAKDMGVRISLGHTNRSHMYEKHIQIDSVIKNDKDYAGALHELGHQANRDKDTMSYKLRFLLDPESKEIYPERLKHEIEAWAWAKRNAIEWNEEMEQEYISAFSSYIHGALHAYGNLDDLLKGIATLKGS